MHSYLLKMFFTGDSSDSSEVYLKRMLQILAEFSTDPILSKYVIDDVWEYMDAMKVRMFTEHLNNRYFFIDWDVCIVWERTE